MTPPNLGAFNTLPIVTPGPRIWDTAVAGGRMHVAYDPASPDGDHAVVVKVTRLDDGRLIVAAPTRADLSKLEGKKNEV